VKHLENQAYLNIFRVKAAPSGFTQLKKFAFSRIVSAKYQKALKINKAGAIHKYINKQQMIQK